MPQRLKDLLTDLGACHPSAEAGSQHLLGATSPVGLGGVHVSLLRGRGVSTDVRPRLWA